MRPPILAASLALAALATPARGQEITAIQGMTSLSKVDPASGAVTPVGGLSLQDPSEIGVTALARHPGGQLFGISTAQTNPSVATSDPSRLYLIDDAVASAAPLGELGPILATAAAVNPGDGSIFAIHAQGPLTPFGLHLHLIRIVPGPPPIVTDLGELPLLAGPLSGLAFDAGGSTLFSLNTKDSSLWIIDPANPGGGATGPVGAGLGVDVSFGGELSLRDDGSLIGYSRKTGQLFAVDPISGAGSVISTVSGAPLDAMAAGGCAGTAIVSGVGCPGAGLFVPSLQLVGCPEVQHPVSVEITGALGGSTALLFLSASAATIPLGFGCSLLLAPPLLPPLSVPLGGAGPGNGSIILPAQLPAGAAGTTFHLQAFVLDPFASLGASASARLTVQVP